MVCADGNLSFVRAEPWAWQRLRAALAGARAVQALERALSAEPVRPLV
jgi:hypothetical protein